MTRLLLEHYGLLLLIWAGASVHFSRSRRTWPAAAAFGLLGSWATANLFGTGPFDTTLGPPAGLQWAVVAALIMLYQPPDRQPHPPLSRSLLPLLLLAWQDMGAILTGVVIAGTGALEPGRPRRLALVAAVVALSLATVADARSLSLWIWLGSTLQLGQDPASTGVHLVEQGLRAVGWLATIAWLPRPLSGPR